MRKLERRLEELERVALPTGPLFDFSSVPIEELRHGVAILEEHGDYDKAAEVVDVECPRFAAVIREGRRKAAQMEVSI